MPNTCIALKQHGLERFDVVRIGVCRGHAGSLRGGRQVYNADVGFVVRTGCRQSIPSSSIDSCAWLRHTTPPSARGHANRPRSRRFISRHMPSPLHHNTLTRSPRLPRNTNTWPLNGSRSSTVWTFAAKRLKPERMSVTPAASQIFVWLGSPIMLSVPTCRATYGAPATAWLHAASLRCALGYCLR
ncbi:hypothetical protein DP49_4372 [Burkholderia pseudomallei]|nr:hypothetical protein DP49_4372 [Burkholderia pseudomallei]